MPRKISFATSVALVSLLVTDMGSAEDVPSFRRGSWPIRNGHNYQPTEQELRAMNLEDVTPDQAREINRLYDELMANSEKKGKRYPPRKR